MKVLTILGSPRKNGNTATVLGWVEDDLKAKGNEVDHIHVIDYTIGGCLSCYACKSKPDEPGCVQDDDGEQIFQKMIDADAIIYASPMYGWSFTSQIKPLIDRSFCLISGYGTAEFKSLLEGRKLALLVTCAGPVEKNADLLPVIFNRIVKFSKTTNAGEFIVPGCTVPDELGPDIKDQVGGFVDKITN